MGRELISTLAKCHLVARKTESEMLEESRERDRKQNKYDELVAALNSILEKAAQNREKGNNPVEGEIIGTTEIAIPTSQQVQAEEKLFQVIQNLQGKLNSLLEFCEQSHASKSEFPDQETLNQIIKKTVYGDYSSSNCRRGFIKRDNRFDGEKDDKENSSEKDLGNPDGSAEGEIKLRKLSKRENMEDDLSIPLSLIRNAKGMPFFVLSSTSQKQKKHPHKSHKKLFWSILFIYSIKQIQIFKRTYLSCALHPVLGWRF